MKHGDVEGSLANNLCGRLFEHVWLLRHSCCILEQICQEFPWFDILDSWWEDQPKYSDWHTSNSTIGSVNLAMQYDELVNSSEPTAECLEADLDPLLDHEHVDETGHVKCKVWFYSTCITLSHQTNLNFRSLIPPLLSAHHSQHQAHSWVIYY